MKKNIISWLKHLNIIHFQLLSVAISLSFVQLLLIGLCQIFKDQAVLNLLIPGFFISLTSIMLVLVLNKYFQKYLFALENIQGLLYKTPISKQQIEEELRVATSIFDSWHSSVITDAEHRIIKVNQAFTHTTGYTDKEIIGLKPNILNSDRHSKEFYKQIWQSVLKTGRWQGEIWDKRKDGEVSPKLLNINTVRDAQGKVTHYIGTHTDLSTIKQTEDEIERLAFYDPLTNLPNRRLLYDKLKQAMSSSHLTEHKGGLLFIDLDNFKNLNNTLGHDLGDMFLKQVAGRLLACVCEDDTVARLGGDEFVIVLENLSATPYVANHQTEIVAKKIQEVLNQPYQLLNYDYRSSASIGATVFSGQEQSVDELVKQADIAMYQSKKSGRNTLKFFDPKMQIVIEKRMDTESDLRLALKNQQFRLFFQPQVYHDNHIIGAEVLIRWEHPKKGLITPALFIPIAEETGLILSIGLWVLQTSCQQLKQWEANPKTQHLQLAVNVSAYQFRQLDFIDQIKLVLQQTDVNPDLLKLELTESMILDDIDDTIKKMHALRSLGVRFSMDDFGTGYSSLASLKKLPLDQLKIDQSFVKDILIDPDNTIIVETIIAMANHLGMEVIAEGVETEAQRQFLEQHNCQVCQGYLFSQPIPLNDFEALLLTA